MNEFQIPYLIILGFGLYSGLALHYLKKLKEAFIADGYQANIHFKEYWKKHWPGSLFSLISAHAGLFYVYLGDPMTNKMAFGAAFAMGYMSDSIANSLSKRGHFVGTDK